MRRVLALLLVFAVAGCADEAPARSPQDAIGSLVVAAKYEIYGNPWYLSNGQGGQWMLNVHVWGCLADITVAGNPGPVTVAPTSFQIVAIDDVPVEEIDPDLVSFESPGDALKADPIFGPYLRCNAGAGNP
jgi:hypothetical protein